MSRMYTALPAQCPLFVSDLNKTRILAKDFWKILRYQISLKSTQWKPSWSMWTDGRTDGVSDRYDEASSRFSQFSERSYERFLQPRSTRIFFNFQKSAGIKPTHFINLSSTDTSGHLNTLLWWPKQFPRSQLNSDWETVVNTTNYLLQLVMVGSY